MPFESLLNVAAPVDFFFQLMICFLNWVINLRHEGSDPSTFNLFLISL